MIALALACARRPGPSEDEYGEVIYWLLEDARTTFESCTDEPAVSSAFDPYTDVEGTTLTYDVARDGKSAVLVECTSFDPTTCRASEPPTVLVVDGHHLFGDGVLAAGALADDCVLLADLQVDLVDLGEALDAELVLRYHLGGFCDGVDASIASLSPNGSGIDGCVVTITATGRPPK